MHRNYTMSARIKAMRMASWPLLVFALACDAPTGNATSDTYVSVWRPVEIEELQPFAVAGGRGVVQTVGHAFTAYPCYDFSTAAQRSVRTLIVTLSARPISDGCRAVLGEWNYRITVFDMPRGQWEVGVRTRLDPSAQATEVVSSTVTVQ